MLGPKQEEIDAAVLRRARLANYKWGTFVVLSFNKGTFVSLSWKLPLAAVIVLLILIELLERLGL